MDPVNTHENIKLLTALLLIKKQVSAAILMCSFGPSSSCGPLVEAVTY